MQGYPSDRTTLSGASLSALATHRVLRNTYFLLSLTLIFSAICAMASMAMAAPPMGFFPLLAIYIGLLFLVNYTRNSIWGIAPVFALTGFLGYTFGAYAQRNPAWITQWGANHCHGFRWHRFDFPCFIRLRAHVKT